LFALLLLGITTISIPETEQTLNNAEVTYRFPQLKTNCPRVSQIIEVGSIDGCNVDGIEGMIFSN